MAEGYIEKEVFKRTTNTISNTVGANSDLQISNLTVTQNGYIPLIWSWDAGSFGNYVNIGAIPSVSGSSITFTEFWIHNTTNQSVNFTVYLNVLWKSA